MFKPRTSHAPQNFRAGVFLALIAAIISGISIYLNKFAVMAIPDAVLFTTLKNTIVGIALVTCLLVTPSRTQVKRSDVKRFSILALIVVALIGGSLPFILFFTGLSLASAANAALIQKSLFIWVALFAAPLLNERFGRWTVLGLALLGVGQVLNGFPNAFGWGAGEMLVLMATLLWAGETIVVKRLLAFIPMSVVATARMAGGALVMWMYLLATDQVAGLFALSTMQWGWVVLTAAILLAYVTTWYGALKFAPATVVTSTLTLGAVITVILSLVLDGKTLDATPLFGLILTVAGVAWVNGLWNVRSRNAELAKV